MAQNARRPATRAFVLTIAMLTPAMGGLPARARETGPALIVLNGQLRTADFSGGVGRGAYDGGVYYIQSSAYIAGASNAVYAGANALTAARAHAFASAHASASGHR